jgi:hypothetical protein
MIRNVAVFCASSNGASPVYRAAAEELGRALAVRSIGLIYGGSNVGLMKAVAEGALTADGKVIGVIPEVLVDLEVAHHGITELHITSTMHTRKALIGEKPMPSSRYPAASVPLKNSSKCSPGTLSISTRSPSFYLTLMASMTNSCSSSITVSPKVCSSRRAVNSLP